MKVEIKNEINFNDDLNSLLELIKKDGFLFSQKRLQKTIKKAWLLSPRTPSVSLVLNRKLINERILKEAYRVAVDNKIQNKKASESIYDNEFIHEAFTTIEKLGV